MSLPSSGGGGGGLRDHLVSLSPETPVSCIGEANQISAPQSTLGMEPRWKPGESLGLSFGEGVLSIPNPCNVTLCQEGRERFIKALLFLDWACDRLHPCARFDALGRREHVLWQKVFSVFVLLFLIDQ